MWVNPNSRWYKLEGMPPLAAPPAHAAAYFPDSQTMPRMLYARCATPIFTFARPIPIVCTTILLSDWSCFQDSSQFRQLFRAQPWFNAARMDVAQTIRPLIIKTMNPVAKGFGDPSHLCAPIRG